jgi:hypothetical protein
MIKREKTPGRNEPCPCGSGKKAKKCCLAKIKLLVRVPEPLRKMYLADLTIREMTNEPTTSAK